MRGRPLLAVLAGDTDPVGAEERREGARGLASRVGRRGRKLPGSSASCGVPAGVRRPWSTSSEVIAVTLPVVM